MQLCSSLSILWHCLSLGLEWKLTFFQSCGHCWVFQICWHIECRTFTASSFRIWNSSTGIPSPPLALLVVMLSKAHFTSHSRMSGSRWVITPSWLSQTWRSFLYSNSHAKCYMQEQKKQHKNNMGTNTLVDLGGSSFTFLILKILSILAIYYS